MLCEDPRFRMSITRNVSRRPWFRAPGALFGALVLLGASGRRGVRDAAAAWRRRARSRLVRRARRCPIRPRASPRSRRSRDSAPQAANAAQSRRDDAVAELAARAARGERRASRVPICSAGPPTRPSSRYQAARAGAGEVAAQVYREHRAGALAVTPARLAQSGGVRLPPEDRPRRRRGADADRAARRSSTRRVAVEAGGRGQSAEAPLPRARHLPAGVDPGPRPRGRPHPQRAGAARTSGCRAGSRSPAA